MATQSKKNKTSVPKKRVSSLKSTSKKQTRRKKRPSSHQQKKTKSNKGFFFSLILLAVISLIAFGYYLGQHDLQPSSTVSKKKHLHSQKTIEKKNINIFAKIHTKKPEEKILLSPTVKNISKPKKAIKIKKPLIDHHHAQKPKLVIIIDDISNRRQLQAIKALHIPVTPSIFPPFALSKKSNLLAKGLKHYMIHLPMESGNSQFNTQYKTLKVSFSRAQMEARIKEIRRLFPTARYINNHTGSVFTGNTKAMKILYGIMKKEGFVFIDSRTIGASKVKKIAQIYGDTYLSRDIFIDNIHTVPYIHRQLQKAVNIARKKGYAIAIGHPRKTTMQALASAKYIFKDVTLVYLDKLHHP